MSTFPLFSAERVGQPSRRVDGTFLLVLVALLIMGLGVLWSASWFRAEQLFDQPLRFVNRQAMWTGVGVVFGLLAYLVPLRLVRRALVVLVPVTLGLALLTFTNAGAQVLGARRWIVLFNVSFQPSELVKAVVVMYLAHIFANRNGDFSEPLHSLVPPTLVVVVFSAVVLLQNDFSTSVFIVVLAMALFFAAGVPLVHFVRLFVLAIPPTLIMLFTREHRVNRVIAFLNPEYDPRGLGYQILAARRAIEAGGFWGAGIGVGGGKLGGLPEAQSDFIFAILGEELGLVGVLGVVAMFGALTARGLHLARRQQDPFRSLLIFGVTISIALQALLNVAVVVGAVPATGVPLPFFSSGGSSLVVTLGMCGLLLNAARPTPDDVATATQNAPLPARFRDARG